MRPFRNIGIRFTWYRLIMAILVIGILGGFALSVILVEFWPGLISMCCIVLGVMLDGLWPYSWPKH